jgi:predicted MFS family arabinose efflux permease
MITLERAQLTIIFAFVANGFLGATWLAHIPELKTRLELSDGQLGLALWAAAAGLLTGMLCSAPTMKKLSSRRGTWISMAGLAIGTALPIISTSYLLLFPALFIFGFWNGLMDACMNTQAGHLQNSAGRSVMSFIHASWSIGSLAGALGGAIFLGLSSPPWLHAGTVSILFVGAAFWIRPQLLEVRETANQSFPIAIPRGRLVLLGLICLLTMLGEGAIADWSGVFLHERFGLTKAGSTGGYTAFFLLMFVARLIGDRVVQRTGRRRAVIGGLWVASVGLALAIASPWPWVSLAGFGLVGFGVGNSVPSVFAGAAEHDQGAVGHSIAGVATLGYLGFFTGPALIGGIAQSSSLGVGLATVAAFLCVAGLLGFWAFREQRNRQTDELLNLLNR